MSAGNEELARLLRALIEREGPIPFARFMEQALYHPKYGYYSSGRCVIGRRGDYFTSVSVGPLFGRMLSKQFAEIWEKLERPNEFTIVEQGAHDGLFAKDVLDDLRRSAPECFAAVSYQIVEPFVVLRTRQEEMLRPFLEKVRWRDEVEPFCGVFFANELLDALPVHLVCAAEGENWEERFVELSENGFAFTSQPLTNERLRKRLAKLLPLPEGPYETEINLAALDWMDMLATKLERGVALVADYGFTRAEYYSAGRNTGTLQSYAEHRVLSSPLENVGAADITAHVEWTSLAERAEKNGLTISGFADQHHFLTGLLAANPTLLAGESSGALQTLLHPEFLGTRFQVLGLTKSFHAPLTGFQFAHHSRRALGLESLAGL
jgi:SAM-dependent MidA family methyltransferase